MLLQAQVSLRFRISQSIQKRMIQAFLGKRIDAHTHCQFISRFKSNAGKLTEPVGMIPDDVHRFLSVFPV